MAVGRGHQGTDFAGTSHGDAGRLGSQQAQIAGGPGLPGPVGDRTREIGDLATDQLVLREVGLVIAGIGAHYIDYRAVAAPGVVQVGDAVGETRSDMKQGKSRLVRHSGIAVGGACYHILLQAEYRAYRVRFTHLIHQLHLRGAWVGEAGIQTRIGQSLEKCLCSIHNCSPIMFLLMNLSRSKNPVVLEPERSSAPQRLCRVMPGIGFLTVWPACIRSGSGRSNQS